MRDEQRPAGQVRGGEAQRGARALGVVVAGEYRAVETALDRAGTTSNGGRRGGAGSTRSSRAGCARRGPSPRVPQTITSIAGARPLCKRAPRARRREHLGAARATPRPAPASAPCCAVSRARSTCRARSMRWMPSRIMLSGSAIRASAPASSVGAGGWTVTTVVSAPGNRRRRRRWRRAPRPSRRSRSAARVIDACQQRRKIFVGAVLGDPGLGAERASPRGVGGVVVTPTTITRGGTPSGPAASSRARRSAEPVVDDEHVGPMATASAAASSSRTDLGDELRRRRVAAASPAERATRGPGEIGEQNPHGARTVDVSVHDRRTPSVVIIRRNPHSTPTESLWCRGRRSCGVARPDHVALDLQRRRQLAVGCEKSRGRIAKRLICSICARRG